MTIAGIAYNVWFGVLILLGVLTAVLLIVVFFIAVRAAITAVRPKTGRKADYHTAVSHNEKEV